MKLALALVLAAGLPACGGDEPREVEVLIRDFVFVPADLRVASGTRVVFRNADPAEHTATARGGFDTGRLATDASAPVTVDGTTSYVCDIHQYMTGKITVS